MLISSPGLSRQCLVVVGMLVVFLTGCDPSWPLPAPTAQVDLTIKFREQPVADARVVLVPYRFQQESGGIQPLAMGLTDENGNTQLTTATGNDQIAIGRYLVLITKPQPRSSATGALPLDSDQIEPGVQMMFAVDDDQLPASYHRYSSLEIEIPANADRHHETLDLHRP